MILRNKSKDTFGVEAISTERMERFINKCINIYKGSPEWLNEKDHIGTINFAKAICSEIARLATLGIGVQIDGSARAEWLQEQFDKAIYFNLRHWVEYGCAYGTIALKPNGKDIDMFAPGRFIVTEMESSRATGAVFYFTEKDGETWYSRLEYHRFAENGDYLIDNVCFKGKSEDDTKERVDIGLTPWSDLLEEAVIEDIDRPLFAIFRTPDANNIDFDSPLSMPVFASAIEELKDLDIAYSRNSKEIRDSKRTVLLDSDKLFPFGASGDVARLDPASAVKTRLSRMDLPDYVRAVDGDLNGNGAFYQEINPALFTPIRIEGINALLSQIAYKVGFSNGYFVFNERTGIQTATGVEAEQQRTIQLIKDIRDKLEACLDDLIYALSAMADLYDLAPAGDYETVYDFGDITYNRDEDRARWWNYVLANKVPAWKFFVKFEGMSEEDARAMVEEAVPVEPGLFPE